MRTEVNINATPNVTVTSENEIITNDISKEPAENENQDVNHSVAAMTREEKETSQVRKQKRTR